MAEGGKYNVPPFYGKAPYGFVRGGGAASKSFWGRSRAERAIKECPDEDTLKENVPTEVLAGFLEQDFTKDAEQRELCKSHFKKMPSKAIRKASGQPDPLPEFQTEDD